MAEHKESFDEKNLNDFIDFYIREEKKPGAAEEGFTVGYLIFLQNIYCTL